MDLKKVDRNTLAKWWCELNRWRWPEELGEPEPRPTGPVPHSPKMPRRTGIMREITEIVGEKAISREWNRDMSDEEFEHWWRYKRPRL